ncbi:hypothetical protein C8J56DRAFT_1011219 [Mycena floridula]|nr:hypothetical protein C8J56DRAFT_1011219 [Mycena floridula]
MSFLWRLFAKKPEEDYETVLSKLLEDIQKRQLRLDEIRLRERRATLTVTIYTLAAWGAYVGMWYFGIWGYSNKTEKALRAIPVLAGPILILFIRRIVQLWYSRKGDAEEKTLQAARKERHTKVEELKKRTNYYSTRDLIQKYEEPQTPNRTPQRPPQMGNGPQMTNRASPNGQATPSQQQQRNPIPAIALASSTPSKPVHIQKQWYDKLADAVLGDDGGQEVARFALICEKCFAHNGLVKETVWEDTQYVCPNCKHFNASLRSKKQANLLSPPVSPSTPATMLPRPSSGGRQNSHVTPPQEKTPVSTEDPMDTD